MALELYSVDATGTSYHLTPQLKVILPRDRSSEYTSLGFKCATPHPEVEAALRQHTKP
jgi:hypothetical protein